jgi:hypothetical protein
MIFAKQTVGISAVLLLAASAGAWSPRDTAAPSQAAVSDRVGTIYEISRDVETAEKSSNGSTSSSTDRDTVSERVTRVRSDGLELEYDLPKESTAQDRTSNWQFPFRVFKPFIGPSQLLNQPELEGRIEAWLKKGGLTRAACGHWVFTWNAFKIDCDPRSALDIVAAYDLRPSDLRDSTSSIDPDHVRREQAQSDVVVAEIGKTALTLDDAIIARANDKISGTVSTSYVVDPSGFVQQRTRFTKLETTASNGVVTDRTVKEVLKRRVLRSGENPR